MITVLRMLAAGLIGALVTAVALGILINHSAFHTAGLLAMGCFLVIGALAYFEVEETEHVHRRP